MQLRGIDYQISSVKTFGVKSAYKFTLCAIFFFFLKYNKSSRPCKPKLQRLTAAALCARVLITSTSTLQSYRLWQQGGVIINLERNVSAYIEEAFHLILTPYSPSLQCITPAFASTSKCRLSDAKCLSAYTH